MRVNNPPNSNKATQRKPAQTTDPKPLQTPKSVSQNNQPEVTQVTNTKTTASKINSPQTQI